MSATFPAAFRLAKILIVDDERANVRLLEQMLDGAGFAMLRSTTDSRQVPQCCAEFRPDLILLDLRMPYVDGIQVLEQLEPKTRAEARPPVLVLTADVTLESRHRALAAGANDFVTKPFDRTEVLFRVRNLLETRFLHQELRRQNESLEAQVRERTQQFLRAEKLATMGNLLAGVAHELNNPLAVVTGHSYLMRDLVREPSLVEKAETIRTAAERCSRIVRNFLAMARQHPSERGEAQLNQVVRDAVELLGYELRTDSVEVVLNLADELPVLWADAHQLHQVLVNLVTNAHQAMRRQSTLRRIEITTGLDPSGARFQLAVADTGPGIPPDIQGKIFDPFFTTKAPGEGTGLGLSLCRGIIEEHGGSISVAIGPGGGTTFRIELPLVTPPATARHADEAASLPAIGAKRLLVVDDEPEVAALLAEALRMDGHEVDTAANGAVALTMLDKRTYDLVLSDTKMPVVDGEEFYRELAHRAPTLRSRIIFVTGDVISREKRAFLEATGAPFLLKPFAPNDARRLVHQMLAGARQAVSSPTASAAP